MPNLDHKPITPTMQQFGLAISKRSAAACWIILAIAGASRQGWLARVLGNDDATITRSLEILESLGIAARVGHTTEWTLTDKARQMTLPGLAQIENSENIGVLSSSSSSFLTNPQEKIKNQQQPPLENAENIGVFQSDNQPVSQADETPQPDELPENYKLLLWYMADEIGHANNTEKAISKLAARGIEPHAIADMIAEWAEYIGSEKARGIQHAAAYVASQLEKGNAVPSWFWNWCRRSLGADRRPNGNWYNWLAENNYCRRCTCEPCTCDHTKEAEEE